MARLLARLALLAVCLFPLVACRSEGLLTSQDIAELRESRFRSHSPGAVVMDAGARLLAALLGGWKFNFNFGLPDIPKEEEEPEEEKKATDKDSEAAEAAAADSAAPSGTGLDLPTAALDGAELGGMALNGTVLNGTALNGTAINGTVAVNETTPSAPPQQTGALLSDETDPALVDAEMDRDSSKLATALLADVTSVKALAQTSLAAVAKRLGRAEQARTRTAGAPLSLSKTQPSSETAPVDRSDTPPSDSTGDEEEETGESPDEGGPPTGEEEQADQEDSTDEGQDEEYDDTSEEEPEGSDPLAQTDEGGTQQGKGGREAKRKKKQHKKEKQHEQSKGSKNKSPPPERLTTPERGPPAEVVAQVAETLETQFDQASQKIETVIKAIEEEWLSKVTRDDDASLRAQRSLRNTRKRLAFLTRQRRDAISQARRFAESSVKETDIAASVSSLQQSHEQATVAANAHREAVLLQANLTLLEQRANSTHRKSMLTRKSVLKQCIQAEWAAMHLVRTNERRLAIAKRALVKHQREGAHRNQVLAYTKLVEAENRNMRLAEGIRDKFHEVFERWNVDFAKPISVGANWSQEDAAAMDKDETRLPSREKDAVLQAIDQLQDQGSALAKLRARVHKFAAQHSK
jgi:hypothetical protein